jgi:hypothetical protein
MEGLRVKALSLSPRTAKKKVKYFQVKAQTSKDI